MELDNLSRAPNDPESQPADMPTYSRRPLFRRRPLSAIAKGGRPPLAVLGQGDLRQIIAESDVLPATASRDDAVAVLRHAIRDAEEHQAALEKELDLHRSWLSSLRSRLDEGVRGPLE